MKRKTFQDVILRGRTREEEPAEGHEPHSNVPPERTKRKKFLMPVLYVIGGSVIVLSLFLLISSYFSRVSIAVSTTKKELTVDETLNLNTDGSSGSLKYELMQLKDSKSGYVPTNGSKVVDKYAVGTITIYNAYGTTAQKLVAGTRLATKEGKIYKTTMAVTVPGMSKGAPGQISVPVKASAPGTSYNISPSDFTLPGLVGSDKFSKIGGKSSKDMSGGWSGEIKTASTADIQKERKILQGDLQASLSKSASSQVPKGYVLYDDAKFISFGDNTVDNNSLIAADGDKNNLQVNATFVGLIIKADDLKQLLISENQSTLGGGQKFVINGLENLQFKLNGRDKINPASAGQISGRLTGSLSLVSDFDIASLKNRLLGASRSSYQQIFKDFPAIEKAEATFSPSWAFYFPSDPARIAIDKGF